MKFIARPSQSLHGTLRIPGDKSISHRALMLAALAEGTTQVHGFLQGQDALATLAAMRSLGVPISDPLQGPLEIHGIGMHGLTPPKAPLNLGNSGTSMRLLAGLLAGQTFDSELHGDASLSTRPMARIAAPLALMGGQVLTAPHGRPPLQIRGCKRLIGIEYPMPMASAQVKSSLLLAGLYARGETAILEPAPTRDHTERMLRTFGYPVTTQENRIHLQGGGRLQARTLEIPADISSAAFFIVAATIAENADLLLEGVGINPTRAGILHILRKMGANIELTNPRTLGGESGQNGGQNCAQNSNQDGEKSGEEYGEQGEPIADLRIRAAPLHGIQIPADQVPLAIDEFPAILIAAACATGTTRLSGAAELRVKESDRIQAMAAGLKTLGIAHRTHPDGIEIQGGQPSGGTIDSHGDHRIAMAFAIASSRATAPIEITRCANVATSFPNFVELAQQAGLNLEAQP